MPDDPSIPPASSPGAPRRSGEQSHGDRPPPPDGSAGDGAATDRSPDRVAMHEDEPDDAVADTPSERAEAGPGSSVPEPAAPEPSAPDPNAPDPSTSAAPSNGAAAQPTATTSAVAAPGATEPDARDGGTPPSPDAAGPERGRTRALILRHVQRHLPEPSPEDVRVTEPPRIVGTHARLLPILQAVPWVLGALFALSFVWDFPGWSVTVLGRTLIVDGLLRIISVSGLIGFLTNWLAITMLFQPREARPIIGQGLIPAQRERVAWRLASAVSEELINEEIIKAKIHESGLSAKYRDLALSVARDVLEDVEFRAELKTVVADYAQSILASPDVQRRIVEFTEEQIEQQAGGGLPGLALRAYRFIGEDDFQSRLYGAVQRLPDSIAPVLDELDPVLDRLPPQLEARGDEIEDLITQIVLRFVENLNVQRIVLENVRQYDEQQLEDLLKRTTNEQLNYIKYLGGVLGFFGGLVIWQPAFALGVFAVIGVALYALDEALFRARQHRADTAEDA